MKTSLLLLASFAAPALAAAPVIRSGSVTIDQSAGRSVAVSYELQNEPAVVTVEFLTNGVPVGEANCTRLCGDVNKLVQTGERSLLWVPDRDWTFVLPDVDVTAKVTAWATNSPPELMVIDLCAGKTVRYYTSMNALPYGGLTNDIYRSEKMVFRKIPAAQVTWRMGSDTTESSRVADNEVPHLVTLTEDFYMAIFELTIDQYRMLTASADIPYPSSHNIPGTGMPVVSVSWATMRGSTLLWPGDDHAVDADCFIGRLRTRTGMDLIDLPTDAQWEFACRAGFGSPTGTDNPKYQATKYLWDSLVTNRAWYVKTPGYGNTKHKVGMLQPNRWGLYDIQGNVYEYCLDYWASGDDFSDGSSIENPKGPTSSDTGNRVARNGSYGSSLAYMRPACRSFAYSDGHSHVGFRLAAGAYAR